MSQATFDAAVRGDFRSRQVLVAIAVDILQRSIAEHGFPCLKLITAVTGAVWHPGFDECARRLRKHHPEYLRAAIAFFMLPRTAEQRRQLSILGASRSGCTCDNVTPDRLSLHKLGEKPFNGKRGDPPLTLLLGTLATVVNCAYGSLVSLGWTRAFKRVRLAVNYGDTRSWPASVLDLAPHGLETSLQSVCAWQGYCPDVPLICVMRDVILSNAFRAIPSILLCDVLPNAFYSLVGRALDKCLANTADLAARENLLKILNEAAFLLVPVSYMHDRMIAIICERKGSRPALKRVLRLLDSCARVLAEVVHQTHDEDQHGDLNIFRNTAISLWEALGQPADVPIDLVIHGTVVPAPPSTDPILGIAALAHYIWQDEVCANRVCHQTPISAGSPLHLCTGCAHTHYCSRSCQRMAWRDEAAPHRDVCVPLRVLAHSASPSFNSEYLDVVDLPSLYEQIQEARLDPTMLEQIVAHLLLVYSR